MKSHDCKKVAVKAQVLTGGRAKGHFTNGYKGGVQFANTGFEAFKIAQNMIGNKLITKQSGPEGKLCSKV